MPSDLRPFEEVFDAPSGVPTVTLRKPLLVQGLLLPEGTPCAPGFKLAGIDLSRHLNQPVVVFNHTTHYEFFGFAECTKVDAKGTWAKGWVLVKNGTPIDSGFYLTREQAEADLTAASDGRTLDYGSALVGAGKDFRKETPPEVRHGSLWAAGVIGPYLIVQTFALALVAALTWLSLDWASFVSWLPLPSTTVAGVLSGQPAVRFPVFQQYMIAACAAGMGGAVFMIREFYLSFCYGSGRPLRFLAVTEIPRYIMLPLSAFVLGPIGLVLLRTGAFVFSSVATREEIPLGTIGAFCFLVGFGYHDTLKALRELSGRLLASAKS